jgi:hypothetical protein
VFWKAHKGREIAARELRRFNGLSLDENDDNGNPSHFPKIDQISVPE